MRDTAQVLAFYYDEEYGQKTDDIDFYLNYAQSCDSVLEIGIGTGRLAIPLAEKGLCVIGIDSSLPMLDILRQKCRQHRLDSIQACCADMRTFAFNTTFPLVIMPFRVFLHNLTQNDQVQTLKTIYLHLHQDGVLLLDLVVPLYPVLSNALWNDELTETSLTSNEKLFIKTEITHDPVNQHFHVQNAYQSSGNKNIETGEYTYRYVFRYEMEALLRLCGFTVESVFGGFDRQPYNYDSGLMIFKARKESAYHVD